MTDNKAEMKQKRRWHYASAYSGTDCLPDCPVCYPQMQGESDKDETCPDCDAGWKDEHECPSDKRPDWARA